MGAVVSNPVLIEDLEARFRPLTDAERDVAQALIDDAWAIANAQVPLLAPNLASGAVSSDVVRAVLSAMIIRVLRNPDGIRQWSQDDYSETRDASVAGGSLYLSDDERTLIGTSIGAPRRGAFSIAPGGLGEPHSPGAEYGHDVRPQWWSAYGYRW